MIARGTIWNTLTDILKSVGAEVMDKKLSMAERQLVRSGISKESGLEKHYTHY